MCFSFFELWMHEKTTSISGSVYFKVYLLAYRGLAAVFPAFTTTETESLDVKLD